MPSFLLFRSEGLWGSHRGARADLLGNQKSHPFLLAAHGLMDGMEEDGGGALHSNPYQFVYLS